MIIEDFFFFFGHYFLHQNRYFYKLHKIHHEYTECTSLAGEYAHIFEFILTNTLPSILGIVILSELTQLHVITALTFLGFIIIDACNAHSGYLWPWDILQAIPYCGGGKFHYLHHSLNCGNYGSMFQFWDWVFNTKISQ
jgi:sterol desaturase/sphingolipid hydroxylase (fatty acid hydroxylase superfamily)